MATVDVERPLDALKNVVAPGPQLTQQVIVPTNTTPSNDPKNQVAPDLKVETFALNNESFIQLQLYLKQANRLPESIASFQTLYPKALLEKYTTQDKGATPLYTDTQDTLVGINNRCSTFEKTVLARMIHLAGFIANYSGTASGTIESLCEILDLLVAPDATTNKAEVQENIKLACQVLKELAADAKTTSETCKEYADKTIDFKKATETDQTKLQNVINRCKNVFPSEDQMDETLKSRMKTARDEMNKLIWEQQKLGNYSGAIAGQRTYYYTSMGVGVAVVDASQSWNKAKRAAIISAQYQSLFANASMDLQTVVAVRDKTSNVQLTMQKTLSLMGEAIKALQSLAGMFSRFYTDLTSISESMTKSIGWVDKARPEARKIGLKLYFKPASDKWVSIKNLASEFQQFGLLTPLTLPSGSELDDQPPPVMDIMGTNYGGHDVTIYSKIVFNYGRDVIVRTYQPGFPLGWHGVDKTISVLHQYSGQKRLHISREYTGAGYSHYLRRGAIDKSKDSDSYCEIINPLQKAEHAPAEILAIVWGDKEVRQQSVWDYCYKQMIANEYVVWSNATMGGQNWKYHAQSGTIYYTIDNGKTVRQIGGRENDSEMAKSQFDIYAD